MADSRMGEGQSECRVGRVFRKDAFLHLFDMEVKRAQRYQHFLYILLFSIDPVSEEFRNSFQIQYERLSTVVSEEMRETDLFGVLEENQLAIVLPYADETSGNQAKTRIERTIKYCDFETRGYQVTINKFSFPVNATSVPDILRMT
jgi:uncharacterized protein YlaN (UPF0358 family)